MAAFRFRLQTVLDLRQRKENESAAGVAKARQGADVARQAREDLEALRDAGRVRLAQAHGAGGPVGHLQNLAMVIRNVDERVRHADDACREADAQVEESVKVFHQAFQERRSIDQLRTRRLDEWHSEQNKSEQKTMDEVALTRHGRLGSAAPAGE